MTSLNSRWKRAIVLLLALALWGCAAYQARKEGMALLDQGRYEEGLAKLDEAIKADPDDLSYRTALKNNRDMAINRLLSSASSEQAAGRPDAARAVYERILRLDDKNAAAQTGIQTMERDRRHASRIDEARAMLKKGQIDNSKEVLRQVLLENPNNPGAQELQRQINDQSTKETMAEPTLLAKFKKPVNLQFRDANLKMVFEALARTSGINILLDRDVRPDLKTSIFVKDVSVEDTIGLILMQNQLEKKVLSDSTIFVFPNTPTKLKEYQELKIRSFHLTNADPKQMLAMVKALLKTKDIFVNEKTNSIVLRDTPDAIRLAEKLISDQDLADPEVMLEVEVLEVTRSRLSDIGIKFPDKLTLDASSLAGPAGALTLRDLQNQNSSTLLSSPIGVTLNAHMDHGDVNVLASPRIRARNREKAKILIGDRVPVITNAVTPLSTGTPVVTGNVQYLEVGLKLEVEPDISPDNQVTIKVNLEVSSIVKEVTNNSSATGGGTLAYQIGTRNATTVLRLKDGETQILAGLINDQDKHTANEIPLFGQVPILGRLFSSHRNDTTKTEIVLSITPRIVRSSRQPEASEIEYWSGTEAVLRSTPVTIKPSGNIALGTAGSAAAAPRLNLPPPRGAVPVRPPVPAAPPVATPLPLSWEGPDQARVGDRINLTLNASSSQGFTSLGFAVNYDPAVLKAVDATEGNLLKQDDPESSFVKEINRGSGEVVVNLSSQAVGDTPRSGSVVTLTFEVLAAAPQALIRVERVASAGPTGAALPGAAPAPYMLTLGQ